MFFDEAKAIGKSQPVSPYALQRLVYPPKQRNFFTAEELLSLPQGSKLTFDTELFPNYWLCAFKDIKSGGYFYVEQSPETTFDPATFIRIIWHFCLVGFNSRSYDIPIIEAALRGATLAQLKELSDKIIISNERLAQSNAPINHIDLIEVCPLQASLKTYGGRLHCQRMQEMPVNPHEPITREQAAGVREYCFNDLDVTELLFNELAEQIKLREEIGRGIGEDLRSKSDAQIAEAVITKEFKRITGKWPQKPKNFDDTPRHYHPPSYLRFQTQQLRDTLELIRSQEFYIGANGYAVIPDAINKLQLKIASQTYRMSIGGLHSSETGVSVTANDEIAISDFDVASYYPKIIINGGIYPQALGETFLQIYKGIIDRRLEAKAAKRDIEASGLKITTNGTFGKLGNMYSIMYAPELMLYVTLTGQFTLLLLIELATMNGFEVISANTDGVLFRYPRSREAELKQIVTMWEQQTSLELEKTSYKGYFARDVNNYLAWKEKDGEWKAKGAYCEKGSALNSVLSRNPDSFVCVDAVKAFIANKTPLAKSIRECTNVRRFVKIRNVKGGAYKGETYIGKVVRWYYAKSETGVINYCLTGNKVPTSEGARPLMELDGLPADIDYARYEREALAILYDTGFLKEPQKQASLFG